MQEIQIQTVSLHRIGKKTSAAVFFNVLDDTGSPVSLNNRAEVDVSGSAEVEKILETVKNELEKGVAET